MRPIRKILCATDFSDCAREATGQAVALASALGAQVTLLHVYELPVYVFPDGSTFAATAEEMNELSRRIDEQLAHAREDAQAEGTAAITAESRMGRAADEIVRTAREGDYDLVVLGTHGRTGLRHLLMGSVAERVVRTCDRPVLTVREPHHAKQPISAHAPII